MPYRRLDLLADDLTEDEISSTLGDAEFDDLYLRERDDGMMLASMILDEKLTEHAIDQLEGRYGDCDGFQLLVYDIAARLPRPENGEEAESEGEKKVARGRISREELLDDLEPGSHVTWVYLTQVLISCLVAAVGLIQDSVALVIAAMVIAPLLLPCMALGLGTTVGDLAMIWRSVRTAAVGLLAGLGLSLVIGLLVPFDPTVHEIASRSEVRLSDLCVAVAAGTAGALAVTTGVSASLIGVMVAVALVPPLVAVGLLVGAGEYEAAYGALILVTTNVVCVNLAAVGMFLAQGISPNRWAEKDRARIAVRHALTVWGVLLLGLALLILFASPQNPLSHDGW
ncbi:MAG: TIGR00341 family protein [Phycisphaerales bacterium JB063]